MIIQPKVSVALDVQDERTVLLVSRSDHAGPISVMRWELGAVETEGVLALAQRVGSMALLFLRQAHPSVFAQFPLLVPPPPDPDEDALGIALSLIHRSTREKTLAYSGTIERLLGQLAHTDVAENWVTIRDTLAEQLGRQP